MTESVAHPWCMGEHLRAFVADRRVRGAGSVVLAAAVALLNGALADAWFPSMTMLGSRTVNTAFALCAGIAIVLAGRFPLWLLAAQGLVVFAVAVPLSLAVAALSAGWRRGVLAWRSWTVAVAAAASLTLAPWAPQTDARFVAAFIVLIPYGIGALIHAIDEQRRTDEARIIALLDNASLREEQSTLRERQRIADELHDRLGHQLTAIEIQARLLMEVFADSSPASRRTAIVHAAAVQAIDEVQSIVRDEPVTGIAEASTTSPISLADNAQDMARSLEVPLTCTADPNVPELPFDLEYTLLRAAQEALTNAAHHAPGQPVALHVDRSETSAILTISNPMTGSPTPGIGRGIPSLTKRIRLLGGTLSAGVDDQSRFMLRISLPLDSSGARL